MTAAADSNWDDEWSRGKQDRTDSQGDDTQNLK